MKQKIFIKRGGDYHGRPSEVTAVDKQINGEDGEKKVEDMKLAGDIASMLTEAYIYIHTEDYYRM